MRKHTFATSLLLALAFVASPTTQSPQSKGDRLSFKAVAMSTGGQFTNAVASPVDVVINRWSTESDRKSLFDALKLGADKGLDALHKLKTIGYFRTPGNLAYNFYFSQSQKGEEGERKILLISDRPFGFYEQWENSRTLRYPFTVVELTVNANGEGAGKLYEAANLIWLGKGDLVVDNYTGKAVDLTQLKLR